MWTATRRRIKEMAGHDTPRYYIKPSDKAQSNPEIALHKCALTSLRCSLIDSNIDAAGTLTGHTSGRMGVQYDHIAAVTTATLCPIRASAVETPRLFNCTSFGKPKSNTN
jgi:hypothetical protein